MKSQLETTQPEREQTPGSKSLRRMEKYVLRSEPMEGVSSPVCIRGPITPLRSTGQRNALIEYLCWGTEVQGFSWPLVQRQAARRAAGSGDLLHAQRGKNLDRAPASGVQHVQATQFLGLPTSGTRGCLVEIIGRESARNGDGADIERGRNRGAGHCGKRK